MADSNKIQELFSALMESNNSVREHVKNKRIKLENKKTATKPITENVKSSSFLERALESMTPGAVYEDDNSEVMDDVIDNVAVVTDPEKSVDDLEVRADAVQDAIEGTPEGEEAFSDEYVGDKIYACPICGESFFADDAYHEGDICPICKAEPSDGFLNQGTVVANTEAEESEEVEPVGQEASEEEISVVDVEDEVAEPEEGAEEEEEKAKESLDRKVTESEEDLHKDNKVEEDIIPDLEDAEIEEFTIDECDGVKECDCNKKYTDIDDESFECMMNEFLHDNYRNSVESLHVDKITYNEASDRLRAHCTVTLKEGTTRKAIFEMREISFLKNTAKLVANETTGLFKVEKTHRPFLITAKTSGKMVTFESMKYRFQSTHPKVGAVMVEGVVRTSNNK